MANIPKTQATDGVPTYLGRGDPAGSFADYYPAWVDKLAGDVTLEGSMLDGALQGAGRHPSRHRRRPRAVRPPGLQLRRPLARQQLHRGLHRRGSRQAARVLPLGHLQRRRTDAAHRSPLPAAELADVLLPPAAREPRRNALRRALSRRRGLIGHDRDLISHQRVPDRSQQSGQRRERDRLRVSPGRRRAAARSCCSSSAVGTSTTGGMCRVVARAAWKR